VIDVFHRQVQFVLMALGSATVFGATVGQNPAQRNLLLVEERNHPVIEQIGRHQRGLAIVELGERQLGVSVKEGLLVDAFHLCLLKT
jgi:hypothetical protein